MTLPCRSIARNTAILCCGVTCSAFAQAVGGLSSATSGLNWVQATLAGFAAIVITIAVTWTGYKIMFEGARFGDVARVLIGAIVIGAASAIGAVLAPG